MLKRSIVAAGILALSASGAFAQGGSSATTGMPAGPTDAPARTHDMGAPSGNMNMGAPSGTMNRQQGTAGVGATHYNTAPQDRYQAQSATSGGDSGPPYRAAITDEYGFKYNSQGERLDARGNVISPHAH